MNNSNGTTCIHIHDVISFKYTPIETMPVKGVGDVELRGVTIVTKDGMEFDITLFMAKDREGKDEV